MDRTKVNLLDPKVQLCPHDAYKLLRDEAPVYFSEEGGFYVVTRYDDIAAIVRQPEVFGASRDGTGADSMIKSEKAKEIYRRRGFPRTTPFTADDPRHNYYRQVVDVSFTPQRVKKLEWRVREVINRLIDGFIDDGQVELVGQFCVPLPMTIITDRLGLPIDDMHKLKYWSEMWAAPFSHSLSEAEEIEVAEAAVEQQQYFLSWLREKRSNPKEDVLSDIANAKLPDGYVLSDAEMVGIAETLITGGNETTTNAIAMGMKLLIETPGLEDKLRGDTKAVRTFVEEVLRLESPTQGLWRFTRKDVTLNGVTIPSGSAVHIRFAAANRDERHFSCPDRLDLGRRNAGSHMAFNQGPHHCSGAPLARQEMQLSFEIFCQRMRDFTFTPGANKFEYIPGLVLRALRGLQIDFKKQ